MPQRSSKSGRRPRTVRSTRRVASETRKSDAATVAWTVSVTTVLLCDLAAVAAHYYARAHPALRGAAMLSGVLLFAAAVIGFLSLVMLPIVYRVRRVPPPRGFVVFGACAAAAPILAALVRLMPQ